MNGAKRRSFEPQGVQAVLRAFAELPPELQQLARDNYKLLKTNPHHPSLHFKRVGKYWSVRVSLSHRAVGMDSQDGILWFWIGTHEEYDRVFG